MQKISPSIYPKLSFFILLFLLINFEVSAQDLKFTRTPSDTTNLKLSMDANYNRPSFQVGNTGIAIGGYFEANSVYAVEDGITDGLSFQARRMSLLLSGSIAKRIKFLSEIEFSEGGNEIEIEYAAIDIAFDPLVNLRTGIVVNPIGSFNQNHDGPKYEFVERPNQAVDLLPGTFSNVGVGLYGKTYKDNWIFGYEAYLTNGFDTSIIDNEANRTSLPAAKENPERFAENFSGQPLATAKLAIGNKSFGEVGFSYMGGRYNKLEEDGLELDTKARRVDVLAFDFNTVIKPTGTAIFGEMAYVWVDVPETYTQQFGNRQWGYYFDIVQPIIKRKILDWEEATFNFATRVDYVDFNEGKFIQTGQEMGDYLFAITPAISFRPTSQTVLRLNYRYQWETDILNNPNVQTASWYFGISSYF
ncbi:porin [Gelidibacter sp. F63206]|uniref:porin n=1 Tax=Gelidibacter sp. F63206 TaxID=2926425 RepID=UPI001FF1E440|nr:porin [Gelidibacter sp. F63206]MCK0114701.1 porin [Gelidibacter sp. F63206]